MQNDFSTISPLTLNLLTICLLLDEDEAILDKIPSRCLGPTIRWVSENLINEKVMTVPQWLEMAFHLCKQRWDESVKWMENEPMSKLLLMIRIQNKFNEAQNREMKKSSRRK
mgnify:CR=1 FL=1